MGNPVSKLVKVNKNDFNMPEIHLSSLETPTRSIAITQKDVDPRSPSSEITRTPIENNILETNLNQTIQSLDCLETPNKQLTFDPRSPSIEITRTPIIIKNPLVQIKNSDDIRRKLLKGNTLKKLTQSTEDIAIQKPGILETDLDYIETDIDEVYQHKTTKYLQNNPLNIETNCLQTLVDPRSPSCGIDRTPIQVPQHLKDDPRSPTIEFLRTPIYLPPVDNEISFEEKLNSLTMDEEEPEIKVVETLLTTVNVKSVQKFIYEDDESCSPTVTPSKKLSVDGRTPLGTRNGMRSRSKSANGRLKGDKKNEYEVGKIPVFNKNIKKFKGRKLHDEQCENTPPKNYIRKTGSAHQWDATDRTLII